jgi:hypothetical protein
MATMGRYCKAYPIRRLREFSQWAECSENTRRETNEVDGKEVEVNRELTDEDFLYLQENYVVTDGIFIDENVIFDHVTPKWKDFCDRVLGFEIPIYQTVEAKASAVTERQGETA